MDAEEKPAEPDNKKEQVLINRFPSIPFYCLFYRHKYLVIYFICINVLSLIQ